MNLLSRFRIGTRLLAGFAIVLLLSIISTSPMRRPAAIALRRQQPKRACAWPKQLRPANNLAELLFLTKRNFVSLKQRLTNYLWPCWPDRSIIIALKYHFIIY
jgi:hypothetical protein